MYNRYLQTRQGGGENGILGNRVDTGDLLLYLVLLLLYLEKEDEELLITLAALAVLSFSDQEDRRKN